MCAREADGAGSATPRSGADKPTPGTEGTADPVEVNPGGGSHPGRLLHRHLPGGAGARHHEAPLEWCAWPWLWEFLTADKWGDGCSRVTGTVTLFAEGGRLKICVADRDSGAVGFATLVSEQPWLEQIDERLAEDDFDWRTTRRGGRSGKGP